MVTDSVADLAKAIFHKFASEQRFLTYAKEYIDYAATHPDDFGACESAADDVADASSDGALGLAARESERLEFLNNEAFQGLCG